MTTETIIAAKCGHCQREITYQDRDLCGQETTVCHNCRNRQERRRLAWGVSVAPKPRTPDHGVSYRYRYGAPIPELTHTPAYRRIVGGRHAHREDRAA